MAKPTPKDIEKWWDEMYMDIKGKKPTVRLTELVKSKWPKLYDVVMRRRRVGVYAQVIVTGLLDQNGVGVVDAECDCDCAECAVYERREDRPHDVDVLVKLGRHRVPMQVGVFNGARVHDHDDVANEYGAVDTRTVNELDTRHVRDKIRQTPPGGITLLATTSMVSPGDDWWYDGVDGICVVLWRKDLCFIYHGAGGRVDAAMKLCSALGCKHTYTQSVQPRRSQNQRHEKRLQFQPDTADGLAAAVRKDAKKWTDDPDDVIEALYYPAYASAYFKGLRGAGGVARADNLVPIIRHVVEQHRGSMAEDAADKEGWWLSVSDVLWTLEEMVEANNTEFSVNALVEICRILQEIVFRRHEVYACRTLSLNEAGSRLHLRALFCLTCVVVYRLRGETPLEVLKTLTAVARIGGQDGIEHRIILGHMLEKLRSAIPDWYAENESLLFGADSPDGMNSVLVRVCSHTEFLGDKQTMEKYRALVLEALDEEVRYMRRRESETGDRMKTNDLVSDFMLHVLHGSSGYGIEDSVRSLTRIGPDAVSMAGHEYGFRIRDKNTEKEIVDRGVQFWEAVLDSSPDPAALYGFGWWVLTESISQDTWERLMLRTCKAAGGLVEDPASVIERASSDGNPTKSGIQIIELILRADRRLFADLNVAYILGKMRQDGVSIDVS